MKLRSDSDVELIDYMGTEENIVRAAKVSTQSDPEVKTTDPGRFIKWLYREKHGSPFEHAVLTFRISAPIFVTRQILKYRISSINERSGRYSLLDTEFWVPGEDRPLKQVGKTGDYEFVHLDEFSYNQGISSMIDLYAKAEETYNELLTLGWAKEAARAVLPVSTYSSLYMTMNLRNWLHFCSQRATAAPSHGQAEIAQTADKVLEHLEELFPNVVAQFKEGGYVRI